MVTLDTEHYIVELGRCLREGRPFVRLIAAQNFGKENPLWMGPKTVEALRQSIADSTEDAHIKYYSMRALHGILDAEPYKTVLTKEPRGFALLTDDVTKTLKEAQQSAEKDSPLDAQLAKTLRMIAYRKATPAQRMGMRLRAFAARHHLSSTAAALA